MAESFEKNLISSISASWNDKAESLLGCASALTLLAFREVNGDAISSALAVANTWSSGVVVSCSGTASGILICLFKSEEGEIIDKLVKQEPDGLPRPGARGLVSGVLAEVAGALDASANAPVTFSQTQYFDLATDETMLASMVGDVAHIGTFSLVVGDDINSQALVIYAPNGSLKAHSAAEKTSPAPPTPAETAKEPPAATAASAPAPTPSRRSNTPRRNEGTANLERLLDVELDVVVRFGVTNVPLRDVVRMGVGTMIELNRAVEEPVELLVNGRQLARGEVVVVDGYYGVRVTEIGPFSERAASII